MKKTAAVIIALLLLSGCSGYMMSGRKQTMFTEKLSDSTFLVTFCGNAYMGEQDVDKYALQRASEVTLEKGFTHFVVLERRDDSQVCTLKDIPGEIPGSTTVGSVDGTISAKSQEKAAGEPTMYRPNVTLKIECYRGTGAPKDAIDARKFLNEQFQGLALPEKKNQ